MGNNQTISSVEKDFLELQAFSSRSYGLCKLYRNARTDQIVAKYEKCFQSKEQQQIFEQKLRERRESGLPDRIQLYYYELHGQNSICSSIFKAIAYYQFEETSLAEYKQSRALKHMEFQEEELFYFVVKMVEIIESNYASQQYMQMSPYNTLLNQDQKLVVFNNLFKQAPVPGSPEEKSELVYQAPLQVQRQNHQAPDYEKSMVFVVALMALELATLQSVAGVYNWKDTSIRVEEFQRLFQKIENRYSKTLVSLIQVMLIPFENERPGIHQVTQHIQSMQKSKEIQIVDRFYNEENYQIIAEEKAKQRFRASQKKLEEQSQRKRQQEEEKRREEEEKRREEEEKRKREKERSIQEEQQRWLEEEQNKKRLQHQYMAQPQLRPSVCANPPTAPPAKYTMVQTFHDSRDIVQHRRPEL